MATIDTADILLRLETLEFERRMRRTRSWLGREIDAMRRMARIPLDLAARTAKFAAVGGGVVGALGATVAVKEAANLEYALAKIRKTTGLTGAELAGFTDQIKALATTMPGVSTAELLGIAEMGGRLGIASEGLMDYVKAVSMITIALDDIPAEEAASSLARIAFNFKLPTTAALGLASALNKLDDTSTATGRDILDVANRISGAGATMGLTAQEVFALSAVLKDAGVTNEVAGTAVSGIMLKMAKSTKDFAEVAGLSIEQFEKLMREDALTALQLVADKLGTLDAITGIRALDDLEIDGVRAADTFLKLSRNFDSVRDRLKLANSEFKTGASILKEVAVMGQTFWAQWERLTNQFGLAAAALGTRLLPALKTLGDHVGAAFDRMRDVFDKSDFFKRLEKVGAELADTFGGMLEKPEEFVNLFVAALDILIAKLTEFALFFKLKLMEFGNMAGLIGDEDLQVAKADLERAPDETQRRINVFFGRVEENRIRGEQSRAQRAAERAAPGVRVAADRLSASLAGGLIGGFAGLAIGGAGDQFEKARVAAAKRHEQIAMALSGGMHPGSEALTAKAKAEAEAKDKAKAEAEFERQRGATAIEQFRKGLEDRSMEEFRRNIAGRRELGGGDPGARALGPEAAARAGLRARIDAMSPAELQLRQERMQERMGQLALRASTVSVMDPDEFARSIDEGPNRAIELQTEQRDFTRELLAEVRQLRTATIEVVMDEKT